MRAAVIRLGGCFACRRYVPRAHGTVWQLLLPAWQASWLRTCLPPSTPAAANLLLQGEPAGTSSRTPPAVVELMEADHHAFMLKKMGAWV